MLLLFYFFLVIIVFGTSLADRVFKLHKFKKKIILKRPIYLVIFQHRKFSNAREPHCDSV